MCSALELAHCGVICAICCSLVFLLYAVLFVGAVAVPFQAPRDLNEGLPMSPSPTGPLAQLDVAPCDDALDR